MRVQNEQSSGSVAYDHVLCMVIGICSCLLNSSQTKDDKGLLG